MDGKYVLLYITLNEKRFYFKRWSDDYGIILTMKRNTGYRFDTVEDRDLINENKQLLQAEEEIF